MRLENFLPALPPYPPLPRGLFRVTANPAIHDATLDTEVEEMTRRKREEFQAKGYTPGLIERTILWAREWALRSTGVKATFDISPEVGGQVYKKIYRQALALSDKWIEGVSKFLNT